MVLPAKKLFTLSDIKLVNRKRVNPQAKEAEAIAEKLCRDANIHLSTFDGYHTMSAFLFPDATVERLVASILITDFLYYVDDMYERHAKKIRNVDDDMYLRDVFDHCVQIMLYGAMPDDTHELYDASLMIHNYVLPLTTLEWLTRFINVTLQHLKSTTYTLDDIINEDNDPIEAYIALRELDGGMRPTMHLIEIANDCHLPDDVKYHPYIRSVEEPTANVGGLMNDIISYGNEVIKYGSRFNLVALLEDFRDLTFEEAVHEAILIVNQNTDIFLARSQQIPDFGDEDTNKLVARYVDSLLDEINATWHWQLSTPRYRSPDAPYPELRVALE